MEKVFGCCGSEDVGRAIRGIMGHVGSNHHKDELKAPVRAKILDPVISPSVTALQYHLRPTTVPLCHCANDCAPLCHCATVPLC
eukprot:8747827-Pyramimonas_sp.AAC.1